MALEPEILKQLIATFSTELEERLQIITDGLFALEKAKKNKGNAKKIIEEIFRAAHNIKGSSRGIGIFAVGDIAHHVESIFADIRDKKLTVSPEIINLCLLAVDAMDSAMQSFCKNQPLSFDLDELLQSLKLDKPITDNRLPAIKKEEIRENLSSEFNEYGSIRVSLTQVDKISALIEQMQINKIAIEDHYAALIKLQIKRKPSDFSLQSDNALFLKDEYLTEQIYKNMHKTVKELGSISNSLQEEIRMLRLVPASTLLRALTRSVRDIAQELNKQIEFEISGDSVKLDKMILEGLKDPIIHLLRNAIDHGIESPELRLQNGKTAFGKITIDVIDEGNHILINISDDGMGIDYKKIGDIAEKKKIISHEELQVLSAASVLDLIFRPEFSTKEIITDISGRGVGLDVVRTNLSDLKGSVSFSTEVGKGTVFHLQVPLTLASDIGLTVRSGGQLFVIPVSAIERVVSTPLSEVREVESSQIVLFEEKPIPLSILTDLLNLESHELITPQQLPIVILKKGRDRIALLVEEIIGEREIVVKPLQPPLNNLPCVAGGTISGTGDIIIVLKPGDLIHSAQSVNKTNRVSRQDTHTTTKVKQTHILLVEDSITTRTLEKNILESNNFKVSIAVDGKEAWTMLQKQPFSLVITDVAMPNMTGFELTARIKQSEKLQNTPVIIVTSLGTEAQKKKGIEVGADAYIVKHDFESSELLEIIEQLV